MEIKVERSRNRIRLIPYGIHGQLHWSDLEYGGLGKPASSNDTDLVEWVLPLANNGSQKITSKKKQYP